MFKIGNVKIENNIVLAPMAGICNSAFRKIIKEMGCGLIYAEMVSDKALVYDNKKTEDMLYMEEMERPIAQQIFGSDKESFVAAAKKICSEMHPDIIDINMGCPVPKVAVRAQAGAALLKNPKKIKEIVSAVVEAVDVPITVKIRSGWDSDNINAVEVAKICEEAGASAITIHGRTRAQGYSGNVNLDIIKKVKEAVKIPVIGNGDITSIESAKKMLEYTKCDAIMIGRGVLGDPWLIQRCVHFLSTNEVLEETSVDEKFELALSHARNLVELKGERIGMNEMRGHAAWYMKGIKYSHRVKDFISAMKTYDEFVIILKNYKDSLITDNWDWLKE